MHNNLYEIRRKTAESIVAEISKIIENDINIMNATGCIIASTNISRIDQYHEAAHRIINDHLDELAVYFDDEYAGCKKGINIPIKLNHQIIGVIGITGEVNEIRKYGHILKRMTEIMVRDVIHTQQKTIQEHHQMLLIADIIQGSIEPSPALEELKSYGMKDDVPFTMVLFSPTRMIREYHIDDILYTSFGELGIAISQNKPDKIMKRFSSLNIQEENYRLFISDPCNTVEKLKSTYKTMQRFSEYASVNLTDHIVMYHDHITDFVIWQIDSDQKKLFFHSVFKSCTDRNIDEFLRLIDIYGKYNGAIGKIAEALHVHKNTVQYRINKLADQTGYDIRNFEEYFYLKMAAKLYPKGQ